MYGNMEWKVFEYIWFVGEAFGNWSNDLFGTNVQKTLEVC